MVVFVPPFIPMTAQATRGGSFVSDISSQTSKEISLHCIARIGRYVVVVVGIFGNGHVEKM